MKSEPVKSTIIDNLQLIRNLIHHRWGRGSKYFNGTIHICHRHQKVPPPIGSVVFHQTLPNMPYIVTGIQKISSYQYLATVSNGVWTHEISWPRMGMLYLHNLCAEGPPQITYMDHHIPRTWYMRRKAKQYSTSCVFNSMTTIFTPVPKPLVLMQVTDYMVLFRASKRMAKIYHFFNLIPYHPEGPTPDLT